MTVPPREWDPLFFPRPSIVVLLYLDAFSREERLAATWQRNDISEGGLPVDDGRHRSTRQKSGDGEEGAIADMEALSAME